MTAVPPDPLNEIRALIVKGATDEAIQKVSLFLNSNFFHDEALFMLGACLQGKGMDGLAAVITSAAIDARRIKGQEFPEALMNLGASYKSEHHNQIAQAIWEDALKVETLPKERSKILTNISGLYIHEASPEKALEYTAQALIEDPHNAGAKANQGMAHLELGHWRDGWDGFYATYDSGDRHRRSYKNLPEWAGSPGQRVIVFGDQGVGDEIFFANSLPDMLAYCERVILDCHPRLEGLFKRSFPTADVYGTRKHLSDIPWIDDCKADSVIGLSDLHKFFRNEDSDWRGHQYLEAGGFRHRAYGSSWPPQRIGVSWVGGIKRTRTDLRSVSLDILEPIFKAAPNADWFSLQYTDNAAREVCDFEERSGIHIAHFPGKVECYDYDQTAKFVASLDLVITVCTTIHHLAGALGTPCWTLVPSKPSWRYQLKGERLPWYDSVRCFRQVSNGDWSHPVQAIVEELNASRGP